MTDDLPPGVRRGAAATAEGGSVTLTHFSLFSGIGGLDLAAEWAGFRTVGQVEMADYPFRVLRRRFGRLPRWRNVEDVTADALRRTGIARPTVLSAGFPCQPFSCAGLRMGSDDERDLWGILRRAIREINPRWFVGENVPGILSIDNGRYFGGILRDLAEMGYSVGWGCYGASNAGYPHSRDRIFIVAFDEFAPDPACELPYRPREARAGLPEPSDCDPRTHWLEAATSLCGMDDGVSHRVDRLRALGNAVVPQQAYPIFAAIAAIETGAVA